MAFHGVRPSDATLAKLHQALAKPAAELAGLPTIISQTFLISPSQLQREVVLWLARSPQERDQIDALLRLWRIQQELTDMPTVFVHSTSVVSDPTLPAMLLALGRSEPIWILSTVGDLRIPLPSPDALRRAVVQCTTGDKAMPMTLSQQFVELGYEEDDAISQKGSFARRGGIVDVWPYDAEDPIRIDIVDNAIETLHAFNRKTQRNRETLQHIRIAPCTLPKTNRATMTDYLKELGQQLRVLAPDNVELEALDPHTHTILEKLHEARRVTFLPFSSNGGQFDYQAAPLFHRNLEQLRDFCVKQKNEPVIILTARAHELAETVGTVAHLAPVGKNDAEYLRGFVSEHEQCTVLTDWEVFGHEEEPVARRTERADIVFIAEMKPGDFVVHVDHGIAKFTGTIDQAVNGQKREYFVLTYAEDDKLFVPVEMADKLSKYIGVANPKIHRLSGSGWYQMKRKIKEETRATAEELLKLYAQRETLTTTGFRAVTVEEEELAKSFPYDPTPDQEEAIRDVEHDLRRIRPMDRLICGDVGFGKTEVAIRAAFKAVMNKKQVAILSPTTILTQQHFDTFRERLAPFPVTIDVLSRFRTPKEQRESLARLKLGQTDIIIGTHRLLQPDVHFYDLGLVIIDEEQRFGVEDKERLKALRMQAHVLTLTATPIPRTLNFALAGIRDITVIETPPEGRKPIETHIEPYDDSTVARALHRELERHGQAYIVYNHVETIALRMQELQKLAPNARFGIAHGQMHEDELAAVMADFDQKKLDVLVCSTIIENGLDLPNVNTLIVDHATNFGLAQLYQLRGRIGRGQNQAYSYFLYHAKKLTPEARKRLQALLEARELGSGFQLALRDLEIRGTGSILGTKQHGHVSAVGLTLYSRLLAETIREMREGITIEPARDILIDLPVAIRIPKEIEPNEQKRLSYYQKLAMESTVDTLENRAHRLFRRKVLPEPLQNLVDVLKLKILGQPIGAVSIAWRKGPIGDDVASARIIVNFADSLIPSQIKALIDTNGEWQFGENQIRIPVSALGKSWMEGLQQTLVLIEKAKHVVLEPMRQP